MMGKWVKDKVGLSKVGTKKKSQDSLVRLKSLLNLVAVWKSPSTISLLAEATGESHSNVMQTTWSIPEGRKVTPSTLYWMNNVLCFVEELFLWIQCRFFSPLHSSAHRHRQACALAFMAIPLVILSLCHKLLCTCVFAYLQINKIFSSVVVCQ